MDPTSSSPSPQVPSEIERRLYYATLPTTPLLVARTGAAWDAPTGPDSEANTRRKVLKPRIYAVLDSMDVKWTEVDITRIGYDGEPPESAPVVLWIKVIPGSLSGGDGVTVAQKCRKVIEECHITDVEVEIHEPIVT